MNSKKVSIIIPVYNGEEYMREAIDSALAQTYENKEIIVINDGSRDNTDKIAKSYGDKITYYAKENGGVSTALNLGIEKMTSDYFSWLSHDDRYYPEKVEKEIKYLEENDLLDSNTILYSDYDLMDEKSRVYAGSVKDHVLLTDKPGYCILHGDINGLSLLIPKKAFDDCGGFRTDLRCVQDYALWEEMRKAGYEFIHLPEILVTTRIHSMQQGNTSPVMVSEGEVFWTNLIKDTSKERMAEYEGSVYGFYKKMHEIMATTPYAKTEVFTKEKLEKIVNKAEEKAGNTLVTVVLPLLENGELPLESVKSVLAQTHSKIELLLVGNISEAEFEKAKSLFADSPIIFKKISCHDGFSITEAKNEGIKASSGDYISFLLAGDILSPEKIKTQLVDMLAHNAEFSQTNYTFKKADGSEEAVDICDVNGDNIISLINLNNVSLSSAMFKTAFLKKNNILFKSAAASLENTTFYLDCFAKTTVFSLPQDLLRCENPAYESSNDSIETIKAIISFIMADRKYSRHSYPLGIIFADYINAYNSDNPTFQINMYPASEERPDVLRRTVRALKRGGVGYTIKAGAKKVINKIKK